MFIEQRHAVHPQADSGPVVKANFLLDIVAGPSLPRADLHRTIVRGNRLAINPDLVMSRVFLVEGGQPELTPRLGIPQDRGATSIPADPDSDRRHFHDAIDLGLKCRIRAPVPVRTQGRLTLRHPPGNRGRRTLIFSETRESWHVKRNRENVAVPDVYTRRPSREQLLIRAGSPAEGAEGGLHLLSYDLHPATRLQ